MIAPICFSTFIRYHISADHRSLPAAHHEEVCDYYEQRRHFRACIRGLTCSSAFYNFLVGLFFLSGAWH